jgi:hypothetical protein
MKGIDIPDDAIVPLDSVAPNVVGLRVLFVNVFAVDTQSGWTSIDTALYGSATRIKRNRKSSHRPTDQRWREPMRRRQCGNWRRGSMSARDHVRASTSTTRFADSERWTYAAFQSVVAITAASLAACP